MVSFLATFMFCTLGGYSYGRAKAEQRFIWWVATGLGFGFGLISLFMPTKGF